MSEFTVIELNTTDPAFNLACEQYVFEFLPKNQTYIMLWQNDNAIIIGKYQNTMSEIDESIVRKHGIKVVRRLSGGGAVYHDLGNLNFTIIADAENIEQLNLRLFCVPVVNALRRLGITAEINGRNDITIDGKKISGNSQYLKKGRIMHHGTLLFNSDLDMVSEALNADGEKFKTKAARSVRSRVTNIADYLPNHAYNIEEFKKVLLQELTNSENYLRYEITSADDEIIRSISRNRYDTWDWNFGQSPKSTLTRKRRFEKCGTLEAHIDIEAGLIANIEFYGDFFSTKEPEDLKKYFIGVRADAQGISSTVNKFSAHDYFLGITNEQLIELLTD